MSPPSGEMWSLQDRGVPSVHRTDQHQLSGQWLYDRDSVSASVCFCNRITNSTVCGYGLSLFLSFYVKTLSPVLVFKRQMFVFVNQDHNFSSFTNNY